jgi:hypothetical protein
MHTAYVGRLLGVILLAAWPHVSFEIMPKGFEPGWWYAIMLLWLIGFIAFGALVPHLPWNIIAVSIHWLGIVASDAWMYWRQLDERSSLGISLYDDILSWCILWGSLNNPSPRRLIDERLLDTSPSPWLLL